MYMPKSAIPFQPQQLPQTGGYMPKSAVPVQPQEKTSFIEKVANAAPVVGGIVGGVTGGFLGGTAGSIVPGAGTAGGAILGSGAGTTLGTAGGGVVKNTLLDLFGKQKQKPMEQLRDVATQSAVAGATDIATGGVLHGAGKVLKPLTSTAGKIISQNIDDIPLKSIRVNPSQITKFESVPGRGRGFLKNWMVEKKILGENAIDIAEKQADVIQQQFDDLAMNSNITIPIDKIKQRFGQEIMNLAGAPGGVKTQFVPSVNEGIAKKVLSEWENILGQARQMGIQDATPEMITQMRRAIDEVIPKNAYASPSIKNFALRMRRLLSDVVQEGVDSRLIGPGETGVLKNLGQELGKYYDFLDIAERQSNLGRGSLLGNLPRILSTGGAGTVGAIAGGVPGAIIGGTAGLASEAALRSPTVLKGIYEGGKAASRTLPIFSRAIGSGFRPLPAAGANMLFSQRNMNSANKQENNTGINNLNNNLNRSEVESMGTGSSNNRIKRIIQPSASPYQVPKIRRK